MQTRRNFLKTSAAASVGAGLQTWQAVAAAGQSPPREPASAESVEWRNRQSDMRYRRLGRTGFMVSEIVMGGNEIRPDNYEHVLMALDMGLNYLDTSPAYGNGKSETAYAKVLKARPRDKFFIASKVSIWDQNRNQQFQQIFDKLPAAEQRRLEQQTRAEIKRRGAAEEAYFGNYFGAQRRELEAATLSNLMEREYGKRIDRQRTYKQTVLDSVHESLNRLGTDHLDIIMCPHGASSPEELAHPEILEAFEALKKAGKVRHLGVSSHSDPAGVLKAAIDSTMYSMAMVAYNVANHAYLDERIAEAKTKDLGVIAMKVARAVHPGPGRGAPQPQRLAKLQAQVEGEWNVPQKAYLWGLGNRSLSAVISNMVNARQVRDNLPLVLADRQG